MRWVSSARTEVVKRKGLASRSTARFSLTYSYDQPVQETVDVPAETPTEEILKQAVGRVPFNVRDQALVTIEREWVAENLPGQELLTALRTCLLTLGALMKEAEGVRSSEADAGSPQDAVSSFSIPACLTDLDRARVVRFRPGTGEFYFYREQRIPGLSDEEGQARVERYGWPEESIRKYGSADPLEKAQGLAELSVRTLQADGYHVSFALIKQRDGRWSPVGFAPEDQLDKYLLWHQIASLVKSSGADAVLFVGEFWAAPIGRLVESEASDIEQVPGRREELIVFVETAAGDRRAWITPFRHRLGRIVVEDQRVDDAFMPPMLEPVREVWRAGFGAMRTDSRRRVLLAAKPTESRLADRIHASGLHVPPELSSDPGVLLDLMARATVFVIDDVALYLAASAGEALRDLASMSDMQLTLLPDGFFMESVKPILSLANPFPSAWGVACEYRTASELREDEKRRSFAHSDDVWQKILRLADAFEWTLTASLIVEHAPYMAVGPVANAFFGIQSAGKGHVLAFSHGSTAEAMGVAETEAPGLAAALLAPTTAAIQLLNRGTLTWTHFRPTRAARRRHQREHGGPLSAHEVLSIEDRTHEG